jgi:hypothetical protein
MLAALISGMFVLSVATTVSALRRDSDERRAMMSRRELF